MALCALPFIRLRKNIRAPAQAIARAPGYPLLLRHSPPAQGLSGVSTAIPGAVVTQAAFFAGRRDKYEMRSPFYVRCMMWDV